MLSIDDGSIEQMLQENDLLAENVEVLFTRMRWKRNEIQWKVLFDKTLETNKKYDPALREIIKIAWKKVTLGLI